MRTLAEIGLELANKASALASQHNCGEYGCNTCDEVTRLANEFYKAAKALEVEGKS